MGLWFLKPLSLNPGDVLERFFSLILGLCRNGIRGILAVTQPADFLDGEHGVLAPSCGLRSALLWCRSLTHGRKEYGLAQGK